MGPPARTHGAPDVGRRLMLRPVSTDQWAPGAPVFLLSALAGQLGITQRRGIAFRRSDDQQPGEHDSGEQAQCHGRRGEPPQPPETTSAPPEPGGPCGAWHLPLEPAEVLLDGCATVRAAERGHARRCILRSHAITALTGTSPARGPIAASDPACRQLTACPSVNR